ncbi:MAG: hypothetical protein DWQ36_21085 [Acidobacteria bacterium]|nr:MAG: hypothetical protein DWQ30_10700 [Acidobacteriota bacterium]REK01007.1 MAG: hypothetical protein DWQ36_21085 [Acidobacteriota bacterium]
MPSASWSLPTPTFIGPPHRREGPRHSSPPPPHARERGRARRRTTSAGSRTRSDRRDRRHTPGCRRPRTADRRPVGRRGRAAATREYRAPRGRLRATRRHGAWRARRRASARPTGTDRGPPNVQSPRLRPGVRPPRHYRPAASVDRLSPFGGDAPGRQRIPKTSARPCATVRDGA